MRASFARWGVLASATALVIGTAGAAGAAGGGYGPSAAVPPYVPGGFTAVVVVRTLPASGGVVSASLYKLRVTVDVPPGAVNSGTQVAVTRGNRSAVKYSLLGKLRGDAVVFAAGFVIDHRGSPLHSLKALRVTLTGPQLKRGDLILEFGHKTAIGSVTSAGVATFSVTTVSEIAIVSPKG